DLVDGEAGEQTGSGCFSGAGEVICRFRAEYLQLIDARLGAIYGCKDSESYEASVHDREFIHIPPRVYGRPGSCLASGFQNLIPGAQLDLADLRVCGLDTLFQRLDLSPGSHGTWAGRQLALAMVDSGKAGRHSVVITLGNRVEFVVVAFSAIDCKSE